MRRIAGALALAVAVLGLALRPLSAQEVEAHVPRAVSHHAHGTAVALALRIPAGSQDDAPGLEGTAWLLARVLEDQVAWALESAPAVFSASVERATTVFTLVADPSAWEQAWSIADSVLLHAPLDPGLVERHRSALLETLAFEVGSPYREFEDVAAALLAEPGSPWARPPRGTAASLAALGTAELERYRARHLGRDVGACAVVGPVPLELPSTPSHAAPPDPPVPADAAWVTGDRVILARDVTSTWVVVAYPAPSDLPRTHLELAAHLLEEELDPTPPAPDRYSVDVRIEETRGGPVLLVEASVVPEAAARWEARIVGAVERMATEPLAEDFFRWRRRRFRTERLLAESAPEAEARRITADLLRDGRVRDLGVEIWGLEARTLSDAARSLGPPRILVLGPDLGQDGSGTR
ncbi:MAG: peptidase M16 family protein [Longimicrobiales bacterium]